MKALVVYESMFGNTEAVVTGTTGPLVGGEEQRAGRWAAELTAVLLTERHRV